MQIILITKNEKFRWSSQPKKVKWNKIKGARAPREMTQLKNRWPT